MDMHYSGCVQVRFYKGGKLYWYYVPNILLPIDETYTHAVVENVNYRGPNSYSKEPKYKVVEVVGYYNYQPENVNPTKAIVDFVDTAPYEEFKKRIKEKEKKKAESKVREVAAHILWKCGTRVNSKTNPLTVDQCANIIYALGTSEDQKEVGLWSGAYEWDF